MPDDINGNHSLTPGYKAVTGQKVLASQHNPPLEDISSCLTNRLNRLGLAPMLANLPMGGFRISGMGDGTTATDAATLGQVQAAMPAGAIIDFAGSVSPIGWLLCYGQAVSRTDYAALFAAIGTTYGTGDGSTTFNVPDLRGRVTAGRDNMGGEDAERLSFFGAVAKTLGGILGAASHVLTVAQLAKHRPTFTGNPMAPHAHGVGALFIGSGTSSNGGYITNSGAGVTTAPASAGTPSGTISEIGNDEAHPNAQPTLMLNKIIKAV